MRLPDDRQQRAAPLELVYEEPALLGDAKHVRRADRERRQARQHRVTGLGLFCEHELEGAERGLPQLQRRDGPSLHEPLYRDRLSRRPGAARTGRSLRFELRG